MIVEEEFPPLELAAIIAPRIGSHTFGPRARVSQNWYVTAGVEPRRKNIGIYDLPNLASLL